MIACAYCERPLTCDDCGADYRVGDPEAYRKLSDPEEIVACPTCGAVLVCRWCKTPYDGNPAGYGEAADD